MQVFQNVKAAKFALFIHLFKEMDSHLRKYLQKKSSYKTSG